MKRFLAKCLLLALLATALAAALALSAYSGPVSKRFGPEVFEAIRTATSSEPEARTLVLGDSVAYQLFGVRPKPSREVAVGASNAALTPLGNRILLDHWLPLNPQAEDVVYLVHPASLANDGLPHFTFHYLLFPFAETGLLDGAPPETLAHLHRRFGRLPVDNASVRHLLYRNDRLYDFYERRIVRRPEPVPGGGLPEIPDHAFRALEAVLLAVGGSLPSGCGAFLRDIPEKAADFFIREGFPAAWEKILGSLPGRPDALASSFHLWFDGLKTLRFLHFLS